MKKNVLLLLGVLIAFPLTVEVLFRFVNPGSPVLDQQNFKTDRAAEADSLLGYRLRKSIEIAGFRHNSLGFVGDDFQKEKPRNVFRIICLGGSTTLGAGAENDTFSYPALLQSLFVRTGIEHGKKVEVINAGVFGYHSHHTRIRMISELSQYSPDLYIVMDGLNDIVASARATSDDFVILSNNSGNVGGILVAKDNWLSQTLRYASYSKAFRDVSSAFKSKTKPEEVAGISSKLGAFGFINNLRAMADEARAQGADLLFVNYPWKVNPSIDAGKFTLHQDHLALYLAGRELVPKIVASVANEKQTGFVDPQSLFDELASTYSPTTLRRLWADDIHFTRFGNYILAKQIFITLLSDPRSREAMQLRDDIATDTLDALFPEILSWRPPDGEGWFNTNSKIVPLGSTFENIRESKPGEHGWNYYSPHEFGTPAEIVFTLDKGIRKFRIFPRIQSHKDSVTISSLSASGNFSEIFHLKKTSTDSLWTPESAWYDLILPEGDGNLIVIRLRGENAQLWHKGDAVLFAAD